MRTTLFLLGALGACGGATEATAPAADASVPEADAPEDASRDAAEEPRADAPPAVDVTVGSFCGGKAGIACAPDQFCDDASGACGGADTGGTCAPRPGFCPGKAAPACGCDGEVYKSACDAFVNGIDVANAGCGAGSAPPGYIPCGPTYCDVSSSYCRFAASDVAGQPSAWDCVGLPAGCSSSTSTCESCFPPGTPCAAQCSVVLGGGVGGFELDCPGG